jgi:hypothetical protein
VVGRSKGRIKRVWRGGGMCEGERVGWCVRSLAWIRMDVNGCVPGGGSCALKHTYR